MEGNLRFKIDWASLIVGRKFTVFTLFYFVLILRAISKYKSLGGGLFLEGRFNGEFFALQVWRAYSCIFGGVYTWKGLISEFYGISLL